MEEDDDTHQCRACKMVIQGLDNYVQHRKVTCVRLSGKKSQTDESVSVNEDGASKPISETFATTFSEIFTAKAVNGKENENHPASSSFQSPIVDKDPAEKIPSQPHDDSEEPDKVETGTPGCPPMIMTVESVDDKDHHKEPRSQNFQIPFLLKPCTTRMGFSCKTCGVEFNNTFEIKKHLASKQHLKKVGCAEDDAENSKNRSEEVEGERPESPPMAMTVDCVNDDLSSDDGSGFGPDNMEDEDRLHDEDTPQATSSASGVDDIEVQGTYCDVCQHEFGYKSKLKEHLRSKRHLKAASEHSDSYCEACKYDYSYPSRLESHLKSKKHLRVVGVLVGKTRSDLGYCEVCQQDFGYKSKLEQHCRSQRHIKAASEATTNTREKSDKAVEEGGTSKTSDDFIDKDSPQTSAHEDVPQSIDNEVSQQDLGYKDKLREHPESKKHLKATSDGYCEVCQWDYKCKSHLEIHLGTKRHREATMGGKSKSGLGYCKLCRWDFKCKSKLESHFLTEKHIRQVSRKESSTRKKRSAPSKRRKDTGHKDDDGTTGIKSKTESSVQNVEEPATGDQDETRRKDRNDEEDDKESHVNVNMESNMKNDSRVKNEKKQKKRKKKLTQIDSSDCSSGTDADEHSEVSDYNNGRTPSDTKPKRKMKKYRKRSKRVAPKVTCKYCNKVFDDSWLFWHVEKHCKEKKEGCNLCYPCRHVAFTSEEHEEHCKTQDHALFQEMYKHIKEKQKGCLKIYSCTLCEYQTNSKDQIEIHVPKHLVEKGKVFSCNQCDKSFSSRRRRRQHIERDHEKSWEKTCVCDVCGKRFYNDGNMAIHMRLHKGLKPHKCTYEGCAYRAKVPSELKTHMRRHTGEKPYLCDRCSYASVTQQGLSRHVRHKHTRPAERLLKCEHCNYTTLQHTNLRRHITTHTGEKPYKCSYCLYRCNDDTNLRKHIKNKHQGVKLYNCKSCDFGTDKLRDFFNHQRGTHGMDIVEDYRGSFMAGMTIDTMNPRFLRVSSSNPQEPAGTTDKQEGEEASAVAAIIPNDNIPDGESGETASDTTQPSSAVSILEDLVEEMSASLQPTEEAQQDT